MKLGERGVVAVKGGQEEHMLSSDFIFGIEPTCSRRGSVINAIGGRVGIDTNLNVICSICEFSPFLTLKNHTTHKNGVLYSSQVHRNSKPFYDG